jgi:hypothetical protein
MKKIMIMSLLAIMVIAWACGKGGGSEQVAPVEIPAKETVVVKKDTVANQPQTQDNLPQEDTIRLENPNYEVPCRGDSSTVPFKVVRDIRIKEYHQSPIHWIINTESDYQKSVASNSKLPYIDFSRYTLLLTQMATPNPYFMVKQSVFLICNNGQVNFNTELRQGVATVPSAIGYAIVIPKIQNTNQIKFNLKVQGK